ncbi:MAG: hypothetical protein WC880_04680, partial [Candidatus Paceibacterota bacterium]
MSDLSQKKDTPQPFYLSPKEAGVLVGYTPDYVSKLSRDGSIVAKRDGRNWLVEGNSLKAFAAQVVIEEKKRLEVLKEERAKAYKASREFLPLREAGLLFGYTPDYLAKLCRDGSVQAERDGREWFVERASLEEFATNVKLDETSRLESLRDARTQEYQKGKAGLFSAFKKKNGASRYPIFASTLLGLGAFFLIFFFSYGVLFSGIDFESIARVFRPSPFVAVQNPVATSTPPTKTEPVAMVTNYNTYNNTYNNTTNEYNSQTIEGMSSADLAIELQGFKNTVLSQVYGAISNISSNVAGNTHAIQLTNRIDQLASVNISGSTFTGGSIANSTITNSNISGGTGSFTTLSVSGDTTLATTTITGPFTLTSTATSTFANGLNLSSGCFSINGVCLSTTGGGSSSGGTWSTTTSSVTGQFVNYSTNSTDIVAIGGSATTSAKYWFDPNTQISYISGSVGIGTTSPFARFSLAGANGSTSNLFAISTSTAGATTTALTIDSGGNLSLLNGANATISGVLTLARALGIASGGTATTTFYNGGVTFYNSTLGTLSQAGDGKGLFWDEANKRLGLGTTSPVSTLSVQGNAYTSGTSFFGGAITATSTFTSTATSPNTLPYASTTALTVSGNTFLTGLSGPNGLAINSAGQVYTAATSTLSTISGTLSTSQGGTGVNASAYTGIFGINNGVVYNAATTTYSSGLTYSAGNVTNTGVTALFGTANQITTSGSTGSVTLSLPSLLFLTNASSTALSSLDYLTVGRIASTTIRGETSATSTFAGGVDVARGITLNSGYIFGAGLSTCSGSADKLLWNATTGKFSCGADAGAGGGITSIGALGQGQTAASQVFATSSDTNIGLTITSSADVHTFTSTWAGVLAAGRGGTGISSPTAAGILLGTYAGGGWQQLATSSLGLLTTNVAEGSNLYYTDSRVNTYINASTTIPKTYTANTFSSLQTFSNGVTSNALTLGTLNGPLQANSGVVSATTSIGTLYGGTGLTSYTLGDTLYASATNVLARLGIGSGGQTLAVSNGIPSWVATTTFSSGLTYAGGNVTNTGVLSNIAGTGITVSGATGNVTISNSGLLSLQQLGGGTAQTGAITFATSSDTNLLFNVTNTAGAFTFTPAWTGTLAAGRLNSNVVQAITNDTNITGSISAQNLTLGWTGTLATTRGGTGWAAVQASALLYGNGTGALATTTAGTNGQVLAYLNGIPTWTATSSINNGVTSLAQTYGSAQTGAITFATSSTAFNGLTSNLAITNSSGAFTFAPTLSGTLGVGGGGTGASTYSYGLIYSPGGTTALANIATSSLGLLTTNVAEGSN